MAINQIKEVLESKGFTDITPSKEILSELDIKIHSWNRWYEKKSDPSFSQVPIIARFLQCEVSELFPDAEVEENYVQKHGIIS